MSDATTRNNRGREKKNEYKKGETTLSGHKIGETLAANSNFIVFLAEDDSPRYEYNDKFPQSEYMASFNAFNELNSRVVSGVQSKKVKKDLRSALGYALFNAVTMDDEQKSLAVFGEVRKRIIMQVNFYARFYYVIFGLLSFIIIGAVGAACFFLVDKELYDHLSIGASFGALGAFVSLLLRSSTIRVPEYSTRSREAFQGSMRIALGALFGFVFILLVKADLVFGVLGDNPIILMAFSILSGYSERYLPNILEGLEKKPEEEKSEEESEEKGLIRKGK